MPATRYAYLGTGFELSSLTPFSNAEAKEEIARILIRLLTEKGGEAISISDTEQVTLVIEDW